MSHLIRLTSNTGENLLCDIGDSPPQLTGGVGGTQTVDIPYQTQAVVWQTHPPYGLVLKILLDGHDTGRSVEADVKTIYRMARADPGAVRPPSVKVSGPVPRTDLAWLIEGVDEGTTVSTDVIRRDDDARTRQQITLTLIEDRLPQTVVAKAATTKKVSKKVKTVAVHKGDTLRSIAKRYKVAYADLKAANKDVRDPNHLTGKTVRLP